jgi:hypothetical protein
MTLTVTRGLIGENRTGLSTATARTQQTSQTSLQATAVRTASEAVSLGVVRVTDAALPAFRTTRSSGLSDKVRDPKDAELLADDVSERIRQEEDGDQSHTDLVYSTAREHFA